MGINVHGPTNVIQGNYIGTNSDGVSDTLEANVISGNGFGAIGLDSDSNVVAGNDIGTDVAGTEALPNASTVQHNGCSCIMNWATQESRAESSTGGTVFRDCGTSAMR